MLEAMPNKLNVNSAATCSIMRMENQFDGFLTSWLSHAHVGTLNVKKWLKAWNTNENTCPPLEKWVTSWWGKLQRAHGKVCDYWWKPTESKVLFQWPGYCIRWLYQWVSGLYSFWQLVYDSISIKQASFTMPAKGKCQSNSAWPLILINYNLPPEIQMCIENLMPLGIIPGPNSPHALDLFWIPLLKNVLSLQKVFKHIMQMLVNILICRHISLQYLAISLQCKLLCLKGVNGYSPCHSCLIWGECYLGATGENKTTHYYPLQGPTRPGEPGDDGWKPQNLPAHTVNNFDEHLNIILHTRTVTQHKELETCCGINEESALLQIPSILFPSYFPHDISLKIYFWCFVTTGLAQADTPSKN